MMLAVLFVSLPLLAQSDIGLWVSKPSFETNRFDEEGEEIEFGFEEDLGYGASFTHRWGALGLDLGVTSMSAEMTVSLDDLGEAEFGEMELMAYTAALQWHFAPGSRIQPYIGGGFAYVTGQVNLDNVFGEIEDEFDLDNETTWVANGGVNFNISDRFAIGGDVKYIPYSPRAEDDATDDRLDVNPLVVSFGVRLRFGR